MQSKNEAVQYKLNPLLKNDLVVISLPENHQSIILIFQQISMLLIFILLRPTTISPFKLIKFKLGIASF